MKDDIVPPDNPGSFENAENNSDEPVIKPDQQLESDSLTDKDNSIASDKKKWWQHLSRKQYILIAAIGLILGSGIASYFIFFNKKPAPAPVAKVEEPPKVEPPKPTTEPSRLTGIIIPIETNKLPVTGIMIENSPDARPQSGLTEADLVLEAIAEGGITRFLTLYLESQPDYIGPVRSVRPYYLDFLVPFDAPIVHAGGSGQALAEIRNQGIKDIDHGANAGIFERVSSRFAPHNLYTSRAKILEVQNARGYTTSTFISWPRKDKETPLATPTATGIDFALSAPLYNPHYDYDQATNSYKRSMSGRPHVDERTGAQIAPKVVVAIVTSWGQNGVYSVYGMTGTGTVMVFQDGGIYEGIWEKPDRKSPYTFKLADGSPLKLNPGRTWVTLVTPGSISKTP